MNWAYFSNWKYHYANKKELFFSGYNKPESDSASQHHSDVMKPAEKHGLFPLENILYLYMVNLSQLQIKLGKGNSTTHVEQQ